MLKLYKEKCKRSRMRKPSYPESSFRLSRECASSMLVKSMCKPTLVYSSALHVCAPPHSHLGENSGTSENASSCGGVSQNKKAWLSLQGRFGDIRNWTAAPQSKHLCQQHLLRNPNTRVFLVWLYILNISYHDLSRRVSIVVILLSTMHAEQSNQKQW